jgi:starvation-inducible DNA-binding protein
LVSRADECEARTNFNQERRTAGFLAQGKAGSWPSHSGLNSMHPTHNTLSANIRAQSIELLNKHLAAAIDLHAQVKQAHWNVRGPGFMAIHELFDKVSEAVEGYSDQLAERAGGLGGTAHGTIQVVAERSFLVPYKHGIADEKQHAFAVAGSLAAFGQSVQAAISEAAASGDPTTADLFTEISRGVDQQLWFVESHLEPKQSEPALSMSSDRPAKALARVPNNVAANPL